MRLLNVSARLGIRNGVGFDVFRCINLFLVFLPVRHNGLLFWFNGPYKIHKVITVSDWIRLKHNCDFVLPQLVYTRLSSLFWVRFFFLFFEALDHKCAHSANSESKSRSCLSTRFDSGGTKASLFDPVTMCVHPGSLPVP